MLLCFLGVFDMQNENVQSNHHGYLTLVAWIACMGAVCFGFGTSVVNGALDFMAKPSQLGLTPWAQGVVSSGLTLGAAFGAVFGTPLSDKIGRKKELIWMGVIFTILGLGCAFAPNAPTIVVLRFIMGLAIGAASALVPVYLAELAPAKSRGRFVSMNQLCIVGGQFLIMLINSALASTIGAHDASVWRWMLGVIAIPGIILWFGMFMAPESPQWYADHGNWTKALEALSRVRSKAQAEAEMQDLKDNVKKVEAQEAHKASFKDFKQGWILQILLTASMLGVFQQFAGINSVMYYGNKILVSAGFGSSIALWMSIANGVFSVIGAIVGMFTVDWLGRRPLLLSGYIFCAIALVLIALIGTFGGHASWTGWAVMIIILLFIVVDQGTLGPVTWLYLSELFPARYRGLGAGISIFVLWFANFIVALVFPQILAVMGISSFYIFAVVCLLGAWFGAARLPETKGVSLDSIETFFRKRYDKNYKG